MSAAFARDLPGLALVTVLCGLAMVVAEILRRCGWPAESTRKLVHVLCGLTAGAFPWIFHGPWPVLLISGSFLALLAWTQRRGLLMSVHGVARRSLGGVCFPLAVALLFVLAGRRPGVYLACVLVLTVSDTLAALVGRAYGRHVFQVGRGVKSLEGSVAFLVSAFLCIQLPLLLLTPAGRLKCLLAALYAALVATGLEAVCRAGTDNLVVPLGTYVVLAQVDGVAAWAPALPLLALCGCGVAVVTMNGRVRMSRRRLLPGTRTLPSAR